MTHRVGLVSALTLGTAVFEQKTFTVATDDTAGVGNQTTPNDATSYDVTTTLTSVLVIPTAGTATDTFRVTIVNVTITKYVRNTQDGVGGRAATGTCATTVSFDPTGSAGAQTYYGDTDLVSGDCVIDGRTGDTLEYLLRVVTPADGALALAVISDSLPDFTTFVADSTFMNQKNVNDEGDTDNAQVGAATFPLSTDTDNVGLLIQSDATTDDGEGDGEVAAEETVNIVYQTTVL